MYKLKEFYQFKKNLLKYNKVFRLKTFKQGSFWSKNASKTFHLKRKTSFLQKSAQGVLQVKASLSNTVVTLTTKKGRVVFFKSCGGLGFKGKKKRSTKLVIESTIFSVADKVKDLGWRKVFLFINGFSKGRYYVMKCLKDSGIKILCMRDVTSIPHNGCRPKKLRRG